MFNKIVATSTEALPLPDLNITPLQTVVMQASNEALLDVTQHINKANIEKMLTFKIWLGNVMKLIRKWVSQFKLKLLEMRNDFKELANAIPKDEKLVIPYDAKATAFTTNIIEHRVLWATPNTKQVELPGYYVYHVSANVTMSGLKKIFKPVSDLNSYLPIIEKLDISSDKLRELDRYLLMDVCELGNGEVGIFAYKDVRAVALRETGKTVVYETSYVTRAKWKKESNIELRSDLVKTALLNASYNLTNIIDSIYEYSLDVSSLKKPKARGSHGDAKLEEKMAMQLMRNKIRFVTMVLGAQYAVTANAVYVAKNYKFPNTPILRKVLDKLTTF